MIIICLERQIWNSVNFKVPILQKNVRKPQISYGFKAFYALIRILLQLAGCLISQLSRFPRYAVHFFSDIDTRVTRVTFFSTSTIKLKSKNSEFLVFNTAFGRYRRWLRSKGYQSEEKEEEYYGTQFPVKF